MVRHHQHATELVKEHEQMGAAHVFIVHDLLQVMPSTEIVQQPAKWGGGEEACFCPAATANGYPLIVAQSLRCLLPKCPPRRGELGPAVQTSSFPLAFMKTVQSLV